MRIAVIQALGALGAKHASAVTPLAAHLSGKELTEQLATIQALGNTRSKEAVDPLIGQLAERNVKVVEMTLIALGTIGPDAKKAVPAIIPKLFDPEPTIVYYAIYALIAIGPDAKEAVPHLQKVAANDKKSTAIRTAAGYAVYVILEKGKQKAPGK